MEGCLIIFLVLLAIGIIISIIQGVFGALKSIGLLIFNLFITILPYIGVMVCIATLIYLVKTFINNKYRNRDKHDKINFWLSIIAFIVLGLSLVNLKWFKVFENPRYDNLIEKKQVIKTEQSIYVKTTELKKEIYIVRI